MATTKYIITTPGGNRLFAEFKWSVSRAARTYGYNICSLWVDGKKMASCNGGGYDMEGTALASWLEQAWRHQLVEKIKHEHIALSFHDPNFDPGKVVVDGETIDEREKSLKTVGLERYQAKHFATTKLPDMAHTIPEIDGASGIDCVIRIGESIGLKFERIGK